MTAPEEITLEHDGPSVTNAAWSSDGAWLASLGDGRAVVWNAKSWRKHENFRTPGTKKFKPIAWSPDGVKLAYYGPGAVVVWDAVQGEELDSFRVGTSFYYLSWSPDGSKLATPDGDSVLVRDVSNQEGFKFNDVVLGERVRAIDWNPDGARLAGVYFDGTVRIWDATNNRELTSLEKECGPVRFLKWHPDGSRLAVSYLERSPFSGTVKVFTLSEGPELRVCNEFKTKRPYEESVTHCDVIAWSPDGKMLASGGADRRVRIRDASDYEEVCSLEIPGTKIYSLAWSPDGTKLVSGGGQGDDFDEKVTVKVWNTADWSVLKEDQAGVICAAWSSDSRDLALCSWDKIKIWSIPK